MLVIIVVVFSICYYLVVFSAEVMGATPEWLVRLCSEKKRPVSTTSGLGSGAGGMSILFPHSVRLDGDGVATLVALAMTDRTRA